MEPLLEQKQTRRQQMKEILAQGSITLRELAAMLGMGIKEAAQELDHVARSLKSQKIVIMPAVCERCDYVFEDRRRWTKPSRCPKCRSERISEPGLSLSSRSNDD